MSEQDSQVEGLWWWVSWAVFTASISLILIAARPTPPAQAVGLVYSLSEADKVVAADQKLARQSLSEEATRAEALYQNRNLSQLGRMPPGWDGEAERNELRSLGAKLQSEDPEQLRQLQARYARDAINALLGRKGSDKAEKILGGSIGTLREYKLAEGPHLRAPAFVIRTFYKARLNQLLGLSPVQGFAKVEQLAHFGWPAFHAVETPPVQRATMLDSYQQLGGQHAQALRGQLLLHAGATKKAATVYEHLYEATSNLRYRNHALFCYQSLRSRRPKD